MKQELEDLAFRVLKPAVVEDLEGRLKSQRKAREAGCLIVYIQTIYNADMNLMSDVWLEQSLRKKVWEFERVLNAYYPTRTDTRLRGPVRLLLRSMSAWRYHLGIYRFPLELRALHKLIAYQRPETSGF